MIDEINADESFPAEDIPVLFVTMRGVKNARAFLTVSPYTHAGVYLGADELLEAGDPTIEIRRLSSLDKEENIIGVFRSQNGFLDGRVQALREFAEALVRNGAKYDWPGIRAFREVRTQLEEELFDILERDYGKVLTEDELEKRS